MDLKARHTKIVEAIETEFGTLIREDYYQYPSSESNLYMIDIHGNLKWFSERAMDDDSYANQIRKNGDVSIKCGSWNGFECEIDLVTGKLIHSEFTK